MSGRFYIVRQIVYNNMAMSHLTQDFIEEMKKKLLAEKSRLEAELSGLAAHTEIGTQTDENAEEMELDELNQNLISRLKSDLQKISKALEKIDAGTYGIDDAGKLIVKERLEALPWADKSI